MTHPQLRESVAPSHVPHDPVDSAVESLASARWMHDPDWPSFKEKLMQTPRPRFEAFRRRPFLFGVLAVAALGGSVAAGTYAYTQIVHFHADVQLSDGSVAHFEGDAVVHDGNVDVTVTSDHNAGGPVEATLTVNPDGTVTTVTTTSADDKDAQKPQPPATQAPAATNPQPK